MEVFEFLEIGLILMLNVLELAFLFALLKNVSDCQ
jgi:hypothetical protein